MPRLQGKVRVQFKAKVDKKSVIKTIEDIMTLSGCTGCGLLGLDLFLHGGDPAINQISQLPGVAGVVVTASE